MAICRRAGGLRWMLILAVVLPVAGCSEDRGKAPKMNRMTGVAKRIDLKNNEVSMSFTDENGVERELSGSVREDTEVWINGRLHRLEDVREGDAVVVTGYRDKSSEEHKLVATQIEVTRPEASDWKQQDASKKPSPDDDDEDDNGDDR